ncbi:MAG: fumarylacetoacetate hydrolase family protein [Syntrophorhabdaceae bacterium]|nr:fumarylacetoacetate hydrolase family protein [Syntrophorhabdaceae bacterium]MDD4195472.1 fumarylacetoacetate hydrolase family protein [Syntrophorhabdaceae bacterium]HOC45322.1 fumarylacetoacetate hydrolase family protein [Syntrophorhabdaceae bacterium]
MHITALFNPSKVIAIGLNYRDHAKEFNMPIPDYPILFLKPPTAVIEDGDDIIFPPQTQELHYEGELGIVISERAKSVPVSEADRYIAGYTCANDVTARDLQRMDGQWTRAKSFDTFCPLGPRIVKDIDPGVLGITTRVNGQVRQRSTTANMIFNVYELVSFVSGIMTLLPGDVIITGTPPGVGALNPGDTVEIDIERIGTLKNKVRPAR